MPWKPEKKKRSWIREYNPHERVKDMRWYYNNWRWKRFSSGFKKRNPFCDDCEAEGVVTASDVTDHKTQYERGAPGWDLNNLNDADFNPKCNRHHNSRSGKQAHGKG